MLRCALEDGTGENSSIFCTSSYPVLCLLKLRSTFSLNLAPSGSLSFSITILDFFFVVSVFSNTPEASWQPGNHQNQHLFKGMDGHSSHSFVHVAYKDIVYLNSPHTARCFPRERPPWDVMESRFGNAHSDPLSPLSFLLPNSNDLTSLRHWIHQPHHFKCNEDILAQRCL